MTTTGVVIAHTLQGNLVFDYGLPAAGITVRLYHIGFGGKDTPLGQVTSDAQGKYVFSYALPSTTTVPVAQVANLQVRALDPAGKEVTISNTKYNAGFADTLNLVVPASVQPLAPEFQRLAADIAKSIGGIAQLAQAQEGSNRQDFTLLNQSTNWDARLMALAATAVQQTAATGLGQDVLYALYRVGLPTDPLLLAMVPAATVQQALTKATKAGIVSLNDQQIAAAATAFQTFASKTLLTTPVPGAGTTFNNLLAPQFANDPQHLQAFANLFFSQPAARSELWTQAAALGIPVQTLNALRLQGKFLYLTFNNAPLAAKLQQDIGSIDNLHQLADKDYHQPATWQNALTALAGTGDIKALIPAQYKSDTTDPLTAYAGDLARKVRLSFPTQVTARMIENGELAVDPKTTGNVTNFLRSAATLGYSLGRTPLNAFLANHAKNLPVLDDASGHSLKTVHRLYQITPSTESLQAALKLGFTSASDIASYSKTDFLAKYAYAFPPGEAGVVYGQSHTISSVTFNVFAMAKALDTAAPAYALSSSSEDRQNAKNALVQHFPSMASLFGNLDFCQCEDCRSVLSPAAYFVDVLDLLGPPYSLPNAAGNTPLDVLIGKDGGVPGRRPDLGALPLTCENTNTRMPYIDLVNEILEYSIAHNNALDAGAAYDTGSATTADLIAEPQHILPGVYTTTLKQAVYPLNLPFDLWIKTVREFLSYFKMSLAQVLDTFRPADTLELFTNTPTTSYYRAQILVEALGIAPAEYAVFTATDTTQWFRLYGSYANEAAALNELKNAKTLSQQLGVSYQELTDLVQTGFLNPGLYPLLFPFERFGINMGTAFSFTSQPGYPVLTSQQTTDFQALLDGITAQYKQRNPNSTFNAEAWLHHLLPANYSQKVLVLADPNTGCDFSATILQYADNRSAAQPLDFLKLNLFVRLWKKLGWTLEETDRALQAFFPASLPAFNDAGFANAFGDAWKTALVYLAHLDDLNTRLAPALGRVALLPLWADLPTQGENPLYAQLFLTPSVLNHDIAFDDPNGGFPVPATDLPPEQRPLSAHATAVQGVLSLKAAEIDAILRDAGVTAPASFSLANLSLCYRYSLLAQCLQHSVSYMIALKAMSGLNPFQTLTGSPLTVLAGDILLNQTLAFVKQVAAVQNSGFTVKDLQYLLRHQFDPVGTYRSDPNALIALVQSIAGGLRQIQAQHAVPDPSNTPESLIDQSLSGLFPAAILKTLFTQLTNAQTYTASANSPAELTLADTTEAPELTLSYDPVTNMQTLSCKGLLLDWRKAELQALNPNTALNAVFSTLLNDVQQQAQAALSKSIADVLGVWASLVQYEAVVPGVQEIQNTSQLTQADASLSLSYNQTAHLQWLGYRGVLTAAKLSALTALNNSPTLAGLLSDVQQQALDPHNGLTGYNALIGSLLAMWCNVQTYKATQSAVAPANQIDPVAFSAALTLAQQNGAITDPVPVIHITYDLATQIQTLTCSGVLTDAMRAQLTGLIPSAVLPGLLQTVRNQAMAEFQFLATSLLAPGTNDPDPFVKPFLGMDPAKQQKFAKAELIKVFLPLLARKLSRQLVVQTLSASLGSDASLTEALISDAALLNDPSNPGQSLLQTFLDVGQQGVSASYYTSPNQAGNPQAAGVAATADTDDPTNEVPGTASCHFEGYLQAPMDGPYRFFAALGNTGAQVTFRVDSPDPNTLFANPVIQATATKDGDETSQFVQLKGGVAYHFSVDFLSLGAHGARLLVQGENLPKGPLSQVVLYPQQAVDAFARAQVLLSKVIQILQVTGLNVREVSYVTEHAADFNNLTLSALPTQASDDAVPKAVALFSQFLTLADYADLRKGPAGGTDGLIDVFQAASQATVAATLLANLTRRDPQVVQDVAAALGTDPHFANNIGIRRLWNALQLVQILGLPVQAIRDATAIVAANSPAPEAIAANFKNAVQAQYTADQWRPIAKSVFDPLRRKKRNALVSYLVHTLGLESSNQLFEYFLVDPGMEPVVQTSRLRLALSSVQTFIQRCLLNLENGNSDPTRNVAPSAIPSDWWSWMKRYRVWQANREIFLFPENWMEPELRLDKTDLFQALESALLQGDVTRDLVEDAFLDYLKGLDLRARLDIVASYLDQDMTNPGESTLYVLGCTYGLPHEYFFRTYSHGIWSGWEAVTVNIEGDHMVLALWRGRLNLFWLTFITQAQAAPQPKGHSTTGAGSLSFDDLTSAIFSGKAQKQVQIQLHWSEYVQGKWTKPIATDVTKAEAINVPDEFDAHQVYIHVSKEMDSSGNEGAIKINEGAIKIHVDFPASYTHAQGFGGPVEGGSVQDRGAGQRAIHTFRVTSKNCDPDFNSVYQESPPHMPYSYLGIDATSYTGAFNLRASFLSNIQADGTGTQESEDILGTGQDPVQDPVQNFALLTCANPVALPFPSLLQGDPDSQEVGGLVSPFFFKDTSNPHAGSKSPFLDERTFFVQPSLTETVIQKWDGWAIAPSTPSQIAADPNLMNQINVVAQVPVAEPILVNPGDPVYSIFPMQNLTDWVTNPAVAISYGGIAIGKNGGIKSPARPDVSAAAGSGTLVSSLAVAQAASAGLVVIGKQGVNASQLQAARTSPLATGMATLVQS